MAPKKLYRNPSEGMIAGICAGLGEYLDLDPTILRLVFVLLAFGGGSGVLIYIIMWLIIPVKPELTPYSTESESVEEEPEI
ncbi:MAG: Putative stress-responsive transcriptional regulator [Anaerolinea thermophila]|jgi:phage shock protein C|uniref:Putative stress-responsive transcriptional regulator n=1 Tax=Anaerolinea thermophila TaxID=167964 RepID=A0A101FX99_9CHLR|nr:MAG: Putative stress-responsive transcriptional regulator [Anaerolinea thermophila]